MTWQVQSGKGFDVSSFILDWETQRVLYAGVHVSQVWTASRDNAGNPRGRVRFAQVSCQACPVRTVCTPSERAQNVEFQTQKTA